jgi:hypothetical protein
MKSGSHTQERPRVRAKVKPHGPDPIGVEEKERLNANSELIVVAKEPIESSLGGAGEKEEKYGVEVTSLNLSKVDFLKFFNSSILPFLTSLMATVPTSKAQNK